MKENIINCQEKSDEQLKNSIADAAKMPYYTLECATLSYYKALMGICQLSLLEQNRQQFRPSIAIQTYYIIFHFATCCILFDDKYRNDKLKIPKEVSREELNSTDESPATWARQRELEKDIAASMTHHEIVNYCKKLRERIKNSQIEDHIKVFYNAIVDDTITNGKCIAGLYEKVQYIRVRAVYRPTFVKYVYEEKYAQTSKDVRKEIDALPKCSSLFETLKLFYEVLPSDIKHQWSLEVSLIECNAPENLGYTWNDLEEWESTKKTWEFHHF